MSEFKFLEFFAGGGMARAGLGAGWECAFANDFDHKKCASYKANWDSRTLKVGDIRTVEPSEIPSHADLAWASFPCQDLSLAGGGAGLRGERSGTFWPFWDLMKRLVAERRAPSLIVLENVCGALSSHGGKDFVAICSALNDAGYRFGAVVIDAALFLPHSRPRLFIVAVRDALAIPEDVAVDKPSSVWHPRGLRTAYDRLPPKAKKKWVWWSLRQPKARKLELADVIEDDPDSVEWHTVEETRALLEMMSDINLAKVQEAKRSGEKIVGAVYKRTRRNAVGRKVQRAEIRFDDVAGCLRTPAGGSSRQLILVVEGRKVRSRLISSRETARLMGLPDSYKLPEKYNEAYHLTGDGVAVPVVRFLAAEVLEKVLRQEDTTARAAA